MIFKRIEVVSIFIHSRDEGNDDNCDENLTVMLLTVIYLIKSRAYWPLKTIIYSSNAVVAIFGWKIENWVKEKEINVSNRKLTNGSWSEPSQSPHAVN